MPKESKPRVVRARKLISTEERRLRASKAQLESVEMSFRCERCEQKNLRCFVETATGRCAGCISVGANCSLFVPEEEWEKVTRDEEEARLALLRSKADVAALELKLAEVESRKRQFARRDLALLKVQDQAKEAASSSTIVSQPSRPSTDSGWSQAPNPPLDPSFDQLVDNFFSSTSPDDLGFLFPVSDDTALGAGDSW